MTKTIDKALDAVAKLAPQDNQPSRSRVTPKFRQLLAADMRSLQREKDEAIECLRRITAATRIRGPLGTTAYIISDALMQRAYAIVSRMGG